MSDKATWTDEKTHLLLECFRDELARGNGCWRTEKGRLDKVVASVQHEGVNKLLETQALRNNSGFGWDAASSLPTAPDEVWTAYIAANPKSAAFRVKPFPFYDQIHAIFSGAVATGEYACYESPASEADITGETLSDNAVSTDASCILEEATHNNDMINQRTKKQKRGTSVADSLIYLADTQQRIHQERFFKPPTTTERALALFKRMGLPLSPRQNLDFAQYLTMTPSADVLFLNISDESRLELIAEVCSINVADLEV
ncbi:hypothetical protein LEN26_002305 [Aphanomyces euteiches]|nr:hypothetical protein LEN26_002305 [Aphanomyces euteiches]